MDIAAAPPSSTARPAEVREKMRIRAFLGTVLASPDLRRSLPRLALAATLANFLAVATPMAILQIMDRIVVNHSLDTLALLVIGIIIALALEELLKLISGHVTGWLGARFEHQANVAALDHMMRVPLPVYQKTEPGAYEEKVLAANQVAFAQRLREVNLPAFELLGLKLEGVTVQNVSLPEELQKILDQKIGMGMVGDTARFMQYQTAQAIPTLAAGAADGGGAGGVVGPAVGLGAGVALGQVLANQLGQGLATAAPGAPAAAAGAAQAPVGVKAEDVMATLEKLADLKAKGILTAEEFDAKKAELLKKLV